MSARPRAALLLGGPQGGYDDEASPASPHFERMPFRESPRFKLCLTHPELPTFFDYRPGRWLEFRLCSRGSHPAHRHQSIPVNEGPGVILQKPEISYKYVLTHQGFRLGDDGSLLPRHDRPVAFPGDTNGWPGRRDRL